MAKSLIGRRILVKQTNGVQVIDVIDDPQHLSWVSVSDDTIRQDHQPLNLVTLNDGCYQLSWVGLHGVMNVIMDFNRHTLQGISFDENDPQPFDGSVQLLNDDGTPDMEPFTNRQLVIAFWNAFFNQHRASAAKEYLDADLVQHNPSIADGAEAFARFYSPLFGPQGSLRVAQRTIVNVAESDDLVYLHCMRKDAPDADAVAEVDVFRVRGAKLVEHWIVKQPFPNHSANAHPMF
ncbi:nuclear transport factor 2 family protein [Furfurilactobacillus siliginis]|uniref:SnoaL-like domain-containing protein n=1 Tax=Furfurilactobacillus siliginis TaxID=348151 RepID=A0A510VX49_9LACO|nr:nuclear transport factor 2 family protein [Furfurilactobacillus siliginis]GEK29350.1 hypothetical protein LSI01_16610 [Furfurilactobacillus siliginis]